MYKFDLYGASGGAASGKVSSLLDRQSNCVNSDAIKIFNGNASCRMVANRGGAGGFISGIISLHRKITAFATIGGHGAYEIKEKITNDFNIDHMINGGYGGGGIHLTTIILMIVMVLEVVVVKPPSNFCQMTSGIE